VAETDRAQEVVRRLLDAEKGAQARLAEAEERARQQLAGAREEAERQRAQAQERATSERSAALASARSDAEAEAAALVAAEQDRWRRIADAAHSRTGAAVDDVVAWVCADDVAEPFP
jgi:V/A-type H+/Na+-transporting ATPase subunit G/H